MNRPILFTDDSNNFETLGIGTLSDAISCLVTEKLNGTYELVMKYPLTGEYFDQITDRSIIACESGYTSGRQPFRVYRITKPIDGIVTVYAAHISYDTEGITVSPYSASTCITALQGIRTNAAHRCDFNFGSDIYANGVISPNIPKTARALMAEILAKFGGEYKFDTYNIRLMSHRGHDRGVTLRYGKNIASLTQDQNCAAVYTGVYPYYIDTENNLVTLPQKIVRAQGSFNYTKTFPLDLSDEFETTPTEEELEIEAYDYMNRHRIGIPKVSIELSYVQMSEELTEMVNLGDTVKVYFPKLGVNATAECVETVWNVLLERYDKITIGDLKSTLAQSVQNIVEEDRGDVPTVSFLMAAIANATNLITGNQGGYVVFHDSNDDGKPDEILIMDTEDISTATKVWRWNKSGLGYSDHGYDGPFTTAITQDGQIVADFIAAGELDGNIIKAGSILASALDVNYTGDVNSKLQANANGILAEATAARAAEESLRASIELKVNLADLTSLIQARADYIRLISNKAISWSAPNSSMDSNGNFSCSNADITGGMVRIGFTEDGHTYYSKIGSEGIQILIDEPASGLTEVARFHPGGIKVNPLQSGSTPKPSFQIDTAGIDMEFAWYDLGYKSGVFKATKDEMIHTATVDKTTTHAANVRIATGEAGTVPRGTFLCTSSGSARKYKRDITKDISTEMNPRKLYDLPIYQFKYKNDYLSDDDQRYDQWILNCMADELRELYPSACDIDENGEAEKPNISFLLGPMLYLIQDLHREIENLNRKIETMEEG